MEEETKSMLWYKFFNYIKLSISMIFVTLCFMHNYNFQNFLSDKIGLILWFCLVSIFILYFVLFYKMYYKNKDTYIYFIICLIIDILLILPLQIPLYLIIKNNTLATFIILCFSIIWFITNNSYIRKRIYIFTKDK